MASSIDSLPISMVSRARGASRVYTTTYYWCRQQTNVKDLRPFHGKDEFVLCKKLKVNVFPVRKIKHHLTKNARKYCKSRTTRMRGSRGDFTRKMFFFNFFTGLHGTCTLLMLKHIKVCCSAEHKARDGLHGLRKYTFFLEHTVFQNNININGSWN